MLSKFVVALLDDLLGWPVQDRLFNLRRKVPQRDDHGRSLQFGEVAVPVLCAVDETPVDGQLRNPGVRKSLRCGVSAIRHLPFLPLLVRDMPVIDSQIPGVLGIVSMYPGLEIFRTEPTNNEEHRVVSSAL
ncbi:hypothetical protein C475_18626 [Halosimplex carlsbadense 2-9-1]|uniref:Uncharacterized protein n=1 Tax=Halosimplex carlsbadense 2-9-1 TaxID=797114 RepID=M0CG21_9EURY|nr:hypothetical protein [Halosimplex carlsbadense]ELZ21568.1 hypothetical protein C475_18626 [Halosimplex carlsbadense 2-9-1]